MAGGIGLMTAARQRRDQRSSLLTRVELAKRIGVHPQTIEKMVQRGCPVRRRGGNGKPSLYDEAAVRAWQTDEQAAAVMRRQARPGHLLTRSALAVTLDCNPRTIAKWTEEGLPVARRGRGGSPSLYSEPECRKWLKARRAADGAAPEEGRQARARLDRAQAVLFEHQYAERLRSLLSRTEADAVWSSEVASLKARLMAWPAQMSERLHRLAVGDGGLLLVEATLEEEIHALLQELATRPVVAVVGCS